MDIKHAFNVMEKSLNSLHRSGMLEQAVKVAEDTVLLGVNSPLDSVAFVSFITDLEERLSQEAGDELFLVIDDIHEFKESASQVPFLTAGVLAHYIVRLTGETRAQKY